MADLRLEIQLPEYLLPTDWMNDMPDSYQEQPAAAQASLLAEDSCFSSDLSCSLDASTEPFPCLADELEQQAKALEREWYCPSQPLAGVASPRRPPRALPALLPSPAAVPALRHSSLELHQLSRQAAAAALAAPVAVKEEPQPAGSIPPTTPTRRSQGHDSSWNESQCALSDAQEVQSPVRPLSLLQSLPQLPGCHVLPPLPMAVDNAESVRLGRQPVCAGAWRGCIRDPWCNREARHRGPCNHRAAVPGLLAYSQRQLFESGVNVDELCRAPELVGSSSSPTSLFHAAAPPATSGGEGSLLAKRQRADEEVAEVAVQPYAYPFPYLAAQQAPAVQQLTGQRAAAAAAAAAAESPATSSPGSLSAGHSEQGSRAGERSSSEGGSEGRRSAAPRLKRQRAQQEDGEEEEGGVPVEVQLVDALPATAAALSSGDLKSAAGSPLMLRQASVHNLPAIPEEPACPPDAVPPQQPAAAAAAPPPAATALRAGAPRASQRSVKAGSRRVARAAPAAAPTSVAAGVPEPAAAAPAVKSPTPTASRAAKASTPSKPLTRQLPKTPDNTATPVVRTGGQRRVILHWNSEQVTDPRTGKVVCHVDPATFCTQCSATHTPVWRAGPFGHKTLCNACGVRYMKYAKGPGRK